MNTVITKISDIKLNPSNPRTIKDAKFKKLVESIKEFPQMLEIRPIVVNDDMVVLGGNMRLKACTEAGLKEVPVINAGDLTEEQQKEFIIKDNVWFGEWDLEMLQKEWDENKLAQWGLDDLKFIEANDGLEQDDHDISWVNEIETDIQLGDIFTLSNGESTHKLICGSATEDETFEKLLGEEKASMVFTDPPYLMNFQGGMSGDGTKNERHEVIMNDNLSKDEWDHEFRWAKGVHNDVIDDIPPLPSVWDIDRTKVNDLHPTMKPVELIARMIMNSSRRGEIVLDLFLWSWTTMVASHQLKRNCYWIELDPKYCQTIIDRMKKYDSTLKITRNWKPYG